MGAKVEIKWARSKFGKWHGFAVFDGYETLGSLCSGFMKTRDLKAKPETDQGGMTEICKDCSHGVLATRKRYRKKGK